MQLQIYTGWGARLVVEDCKILDKTCPGDAAEATIMVDFGAFLYTVLVSLPATTSFSSVHEAFASLTRVPMHYQPTRGECHETPDVGFYGSLERAVAKATDFNPTQRSPVAFVGQESIYGMPDHDERTDYGPLTTHPGSNIFLRLPDRTIAELWRWQGERPSQGRDRAATKDFPQWHRITEAHHPVWVGDRLTVVRGNVQDGGSPTWERFV